MHCSTSSTAQVTRSRMQLIKPASAYSLGAVHDTAAPWHSMGDDVQPSGCHRSIICTCAWSANTHVERTQITYMQECSSQSMITEQRGAVGRTWTLKMPTTPLPPLLVFHTWTSCSPVMRSWHSTARRQVVSDTTMGHAPRSPAAAQEGAHGRSLPLLGRRVAKAWSQP